jgi:SAM-dependent methyltransferase
MRFVRADDLEAIPEPNRLNYLFETLWLAQNLAQAAKLLQIGSMDGRRLIRLLEVRPDLRATGLEIDGQLAVTARKNMAADGFTARIVQGDITDPPELGHFDWIVCLNHTLGYIADEGEAIANMRLLGDRLAISVYGERFDDVLAERYFRVIGEDGTVVRRYTRADVQAWGGEIVETPLGYLCLA